MVKLNIDDIKQAMIHKGFHVTGSQFVALNTEQLLKDLHSDFPNLDKPVYAGYLTYNPQVIGQMFKHDGIVNAVFPAGVIFSSLKRESQDIIVNMQAPWDFWEIHQPFTSQQTFHIFDALHCKEILTDESVYSNLDQAYATNISLIDFTLSDFILNQATYNNYSLFTFLGYKLTVAV
jgi:hypothetical protein